MREDKLLAGAPQRAIAGITPGHIVFAAMAVICSSSSGGGALLCVGGGPIHSIASSRSADGEGSIAIRAVDASQLG
ncbi:MULTISPECIES: hypothetical protein [unclassified Mesorhizobium]|uniref:hypothetical protein n=1 Tax=unclassified Mesorhizobium TaxID=325217 RepID=UPI001CCB3E62|nr:MULTISPECIES: hypothetical protein [unclassified Mesorhizobium]MBZ9743577.1 hypothetical protein [Mesorhizobium sp. CO1-1-4]MBZ9806237.1 hypothetical protein [Mesorhizobium sp. ES1-6]